MSASMKDSELVVCALLWLASLALLVVWVAGGDWRYAIGGGVTFILSRLVVVEAALRTLLERGR